MKRLQTAFCVLVASVLFLGCKKETESEMTQNKIEVKAITKSEYAKTPDGKSVEKYTLENANGMKMEVITFGGIITSLTAPDKNGKFEDVVLSFTNPDDYFNGNPYFFGAIIGRFGNRIAKGKFELDGKQYTLPTNDGPNHLHGGKGFDKVIWNASVVEAAENPTLKLTYESKDGDQGYPGNLSVSVTYVLTNDNALEITYDAKSDKKTVVNLTQHSYFNLSANFANTILDHELQLKADKMIPVDATLIPTGEITAVAETPFDFTSAKQIGKDIETTDEQLKRGLGYDHCWVFTDSATTVRSVGSLYHKASGRYMEILTDQPGVQFYSGNFLDGKKASKTGGNYEKRSGLCLETQHFPDSPNQPKFPSVVLNPGENYHTQTVYKFSAK